MPDKENMRSFIRENEGLLREYLDIRGNIVKLRFTQVFSKLAGHFIWVVISLFLFFLLAIFTGMVAGFWLTEITGSYIKGFGLTLLTIVVLILLLAAARKALIINPIIRSVIERINYNPEPEITEETD